MSNLTQQEASFLNHVLLAREAAADYQASFQQTAECTHLALQLARPWLKNTNARRWLTSGAGPLAKKLLEELLADDRPLLDARAPQNIDLARFFEDQLGRSVRNQFGVFYTPREVASYIVRQTDTILREEFDLTDGLADTSTWGDICRRHDLDLPKNASSSDPFVQILDPAAGTGVFVIAVIDVVFQTLREKWQADRCSDADLIQRWNDYVPRHLFPRMYGVESMLPAVAIAHINVATKLADTGFDFATDERLRLYVGNSLAGPNESNGNADTWRPPLRQERKGTDDARHRLPITVILGNPPYSAASNNRNRWIEDLIRGRDASGGQTANYYEIDGAPLRERKLWLHDDYVKFMRYCQWRLEQAGCGVSALVTNHGYLDNPTFRGMRQQLMKAFPRVTIVDLHGNQKKKERPPDGERNESVFEIEQGVAIGLFRKPPNFQAPGTVDYCDVWGSREEKLKTLDCARGSLTRPTNIQAGSPFYFFVPRDESRRDEYLRGFKLTDIMPVNTTAVVTARDRFVIACQREDLLARLRQFRDLSISDDEIRNRYFTNSRSRHFPPGDTRGWTMAKARRRLAADADWEEKVRTCLYRPLDRRFTYWSDEMIDWPRTDVMQHMQNGDNVALIARRQMPAGQPCNYFWIADDIVIDGYVRSDNRGSESVFPLYLYDVENTRRANFTPSFIEALQESSGLRWIGQGGGDLLESIGANDLLHLIYATFHSSEYRQRFAEQLSVDFPRVFPPRNVTIARGLSQAGERLANVHLMRQDHATVPTHQFVFESQPNTMIERGFPKYTSGNVHLNAHAFFANVPAETWNWQVGAYQVCRKWLKSRGGQTLSETEIAHFQTILRTAGVHHETVAGIDNLISRNGGWEKCFCAG